MGTTISGAGTGVTASAGFAGASLSAGNTNATVRMKNTRTQHTGRKKKQLNYNPREISGQLLRATKSRSASMVLARAKSKVSMLHRCLGTGQYNENEVRNAISHANRIVRCAKLKVQNLKEEEQFRKRYESEHTNKERQQKIEAKRRVSQKEREVETKMTLDENQQILKEKMMRQEFLRKKRSHRNVERGKINEADMKYLKNQLKENGNSSTNTSGAVFEMSAQAAALSEIQLSEHALELLEQQELALEMAADMNVSMETGNMAMPVETASIPMSVDILV